MKCGCVRLGFLRCLLNANCETRVSCETGREGFFSHFLKPFKLLFTFFFSNTDLSSPECLPNQGFFLSPHSFVTLQNLFGRQRCFPIPEGSDSHDDVPDLKVLDSRCILWRPLCFCLGTCWSLCSAGHRCESRAVQTKVNSKPGNLGFI